MYLGDFNQNASINFKFTTRDYAGIPTVLVSGAVSIYKGNSLVNTTSGVTLTANFNSVAGLNHVNIDTSVNSAFYSTGADYQVILSTGYVNLTPVAGEVLEEFSIRNRYNTPDSVNVLTLADGVETGYTLQQAMRLILATSAGKLNGAETSTINIRDINDTKNRIVATVTESGNRTALTIDAN